MSMNDYNGPGFVFQQAFTGKAWHEPHMSLKVCSNIEAPGMASLVQFLIVSFSVVIGSNVWSEQNQSSPPMSFDT